MKPFLPKQHGAWAMLIVPFIIGTFIGDPSLIHIPFFLSWLFIYMATYMGLTSLRIKKNDKFIKWAFIYSVIGIPLALITTLMNLNIVYFLVAMLPFFCINVYYAKTNNERALLNDFAAIVIFSIGGLAAYFAGTNTINTTSIIATLATLLFFFTCTLYVKTMIREKSNTMYRWYSWGGHSLVIIIFVAFSYNLIALAFLFSLARAVYMYGKVASPMKVGIIEIVNSTYFTLIVIFALI
jgi:hypothetical protein